MAAVLERLEGVEPLNLEVNLKMVLFRVPTWNGCQDTVEALKR